MPFKSIEIQLYPTKDQEVLLNKTLGCARFVYNYILAKKIKHLNSKNKKFFNYVQWAHKIVLMKRKEKFTWLKEVEHQVLLQSLRDLNTAFTNCYKHSKGFPKFHKKGIKDSFRSPQITKNIRIEGNHINLPKLKLIRFRGNKHLLQGIKINNVTVKLKAGKWFAYILTEDNKCYLDEPPLDTVGIDVGVVNPLTLHFRDEGHHYQFLGKEFSKKLKKLEKKRAKIQRALARKKKASKNRVKTKLRLQKAFLKETNVRKDFIEKTSHYLSTTFKVIKFEDLRLQAMTTHGGNYKRKMNDGMRRLGLGKLMDRTIDKSEKFGSTVNFVNPRFTSQDCPKCQWRDKANRRSQSKFKCVNCGHAKHADKIAALNIYRRSAA